MERKTKIINRKKLMLFFVAVFMLMCSLTMSGAMAANENAKIPEARSIAHGERVIASEPLKLQLLEFADNGYEHSVKLVDAPASVKIDKNGLLTGTFTSTGKGVMDISLEVSWKNYKATQNFNIPIYGVDKADVVKLPEKAESIKANQKISVKAAGTQKWYKFVCPFYSFTIGRENRDEGESVTVYNQKGLYVKPYGYGGYDGASYESKYGEVYYICASGDIDFQIYARTWVPTRTNTNKIDSTGYKLIATNVNKSFAGDSNKTWDVYEATGKINHSFSGGFTWECIGTMESVASPVNVHKVTSVVSENQKIIYTVNYKYDPNNAEECEEIGASTEQETMKDELRSGEKEYRLDNVYYLIPNTKTLKITEKHHLYVPVGYVYDDGHIVKFNPNNLGKPSKITASQSDKAIKLDWNAVAGATGYKVYQMINGKWVAVATTTGTTKTISGLKAGTKYSFAVKAGTKSGGKVVWAKGYTSIATATKAVKISKITSTQTTSSINLTWAKSVGATGYRIYYKSGNTWKIAVKATAATSHNFKNLKAGTKFTFAVRPYVKTDSGIVWSDYATFTTSTLPSNPTVKVTAPSKGKLAVNWKAVTGAEGYQIYYKAGNGNYKLYKTYTKAGTLNFSNLKSGAKYTFAVRAVINTSAGAVRSGFTPVTVTVK